MYDGRGSSRGQVLIIFVFAIIGLIAIAGLAIDGSNILSDRRHAQNAADTAALAAAVTRDNWVAAHSGTPCDNFNTATNTLPSNGCDAVNKALDIAGTNGFSANGTDITVDVYSPPVDGYYATCSNGDCDPHNYIEVVIHHDVQTWFARVVGMAQTHNTVQAVALAVATHKGSPFPSDAIVGLDPDPSHLSFQAQSNAQKWNIKGGGIFANGDALDKHSTVVMDPGYCITSVGTATGFQCGGSSNNPALLLHYPADVLAMLPPIPSCKGTAYYDKKDGMVHPDKNASLSATGSVWNSFDTHPAFAPGLYCMKNVGKEIIHSDVTGTGVTFYIMDSNFDVKFDGKTGSFAVTAPQGDPSYAYNGVLMFSAVVASGGNCTQNMEFRGNGTTPVVGTIMLPGACINWLGNSSAAAADTQLVGWQIYSNGTADANFNYNANNNYKYTYPGQVGIMH